MDQKDQKTIIDFINSYKGTRIHTSEIENITNLETEKVKEFLSDLFSGGKTEVSGLQRSGNFEYSNGWIEFDKVPVDNSKVLRYRNLGLLSFILGIISIALIQVVSWMSIFALVFFLSGFYLIAFAIRLYSNMSEQERAIGSFYVLKFFY